MLAQSVGHHGEVFRVTAPEAYVPRMMDQGYTPEDDIGPFIGEDWGEGGARSRSLPRASGEPQRSRRRRQLQGTTNLSGIGLC